MRLSHSIVVGTASICFMICGCAETQTPQGPEVGSVQAYLDENPEALIEEDVASEEEEMSASEDE